MQSILSRRRWFFARITGRRRIGKTTLVQRALREVDGIPVLYVQIPDSAPAGVLAAVGSAMEIFELTRHYEPPKTLLQLAHLIQDLARAGYVVALDEFQYFSRKPLFEFTSHLQAVVDELSAQAADVPGGLVVLGSLHAELVALLEDRQAPLYNRTTDHIELDHLDTASVLTILKAHADTTSERLLFLWNLFEGVPKFYRDCFEQGVIGSDRRALLRKMFFQSSSPLRTEAENWFLSELRGRYDVVLKFVSKNPGCTNGDIVAHVREISVENADQVGGHLKILRDKYRMLERKVPIFAQATSKKGRYYIRDNFLRSWLAALADPVAALNFRPEEQLVERADERLKVAEGYALERLAAQLYEERSRLGIGDFALTKRIEGYWNKAETELDLVALDEESKIVRFGTCKRNADKLLPDLKNYDGHIQRFLDAHARLQTWRIERVAIAPNIPQSLRPQLERAGYRPQDLADLSQGLMP